MKFKENISEGIDPLKATKGTAEEFKYIDLTELFTKLIFFANLSQFIAKESQKMFSGKIIIAIVPFF